MRVKDDSKGPWMGVCGGVDVDLGRGMTRIGLDIFWDELKREWWGVLG